MFQALSDKFKFVLNKIAKNNILNENSLSELLREFRMVLLEADVPVELSKEIISSLKEQLLNKEIYRTLNAKDVITKALYDVLLNILKDNQQQPLTKNSKYIMLIGLQGVGKTTSAAKLAYYLTTKHNKNVLLVSLDLQRKAAYEQLQILCKDNNLNFFTYNNLNTSLMEVLNLLILHIEQNNYDHIILDTAGRLSIDEPLMQQLKIIQEKLLVSQCWLVLDALLGQSSIQVIKDFNTNNNINGLVITKADSDYKGGLIIAAKYITGTDIKFLGSGEKINQIQQFDAEKVVSKILGQVDLEELSEKFENIEQEEAKELEQNMLKGIFSLNDYKKQLNLMNKIGGIGSIAKFIPGVASMSNAINNTKLNNTFKKHIAIINSMTKEEKIKPNILNFSRKKRIATGSGTSLSDINILLKQYTSMAGMMKNFGKMGLGTKNNIPNSNEITKALSSFTGNKNLSNFNLDKFLKK